MIDPSDPLRTRVREWMQGEKQAPLGDADLKRIVQNLATDRARTRAFPHAAAAFAMAAVVVIGFMVWPRHADERAVVHPPSVSTEVAEESRRPCETRTVASQVQFSQRPDRTSAMDLGAALIVLDAGSEASVRIVEACRFEIALNSGRVNVHARDLGGGTLRVVTPSGDVSVVGTMFSVHHDGVDVLDVSVVEGRVKIGGCGTSEEASGERVTRKGCEAARREAVPRDQSATIRAALGLGTLDATQANTAGPSGTRAARALSPAEAEDLAMKAEQARRSGDLAEARRLFRLVGTSSNPQAEAAWLSLARLELRAQQLREARDALLERARRFPRGALGAEAAWIEVTIAQEDGDRSRMREVAQELIARWPRSPQAEDAKRLLESTTP